MKSRPILHRFVFKCPRCGRGFEGFTRVGALDKVGQHAKRGDCRPKKTPTPSAQLDLLVPR